MKLKVELFRYETLVFGKILEQNGIERGCGEICEKDEYSIYSFVNPAITIKDKKNCLFVESAMKRIISQYFGILIVKAKQSNGAKKSKS